MLYRLARGYFTWVHDNTLAPLRASSCGCRCDRGVCTLLCHFPAESVIGVVPGVMVVRAGRLTPSFPVPRPAVVLTVTTSTDAEYYCSLNSSMSLIHAAAAVGSVTIVTSE